jgi:hypothetical protein
MLNEEQVKEMKKLAEFNYEFNLNLARVATCEDKDRIAILYDAACNLKEVMSYISKLADLQEAKTVVKQ